VFPVPPEAATKAATAGESPAEEGDVGTKPASPS
jgi:hypothetical protein